MNKRLQFPLAYKEEQISLNSCGFTVEMKGHLYEYVSKNSNPILHTKLKHIPIFV